MLFEAIRRSLSWLDAHDGKKPPEWEDPGAGRRAGRAAGRGDAIAWCRTRGDAAPAGDPRHRVPGLRAGAPHAAGRDPRRDRGRRGLAARRRGAGPAGGTQLVAFAIGAPLEQSKDVEGCDDDPMLGKHNTMYSVSITVAPSYQARASAGSSRRCSCATRWRASAPTAARYRYVTGRNRVGRTAQMTHLNRVFGAHVVSVLTGQYEDPEGQAIYYRIPLGAFAPDPARAGRRRAPRGDARRRRRDRARSRVGPHPAVRAAAGVAARRRGRAACCTAPR